MVGPRLSNFDNPFCQFLIIPFVLITAILLFHMKYLAQVPVSNVLWHIIMNTDIYNIYSGIYAYLYYRHIRFIIIIIIILFIIVDISFVIIRWLFLSCVDLCGWRKYTLLNLTLKWTIYHTWPPYWGQQWQWYHLIANTGHNNTGHNYHTFLHLHNISTPLITFLIILLIVISLVFYSDSNSSVL